MAKLSTLEKAAKSVADKCAACNRCFEDSSTFAQVERKGNGGGVSRGGTMMMVGSNGNSDELQLPLANCVCIDCPNTFKRHRLREQLIEASATSDVLGLT